MLRAFFEIGCDKTLFDGLEISKEEDLCREYMGRFPVVSVSFKGVEAEDYETARDMMIEVINEEARRLRYVLESDRFSLEDKKTFSVLMKGNMDQGTPVPQPAQAFGIT